MHADRHKEHLAALRQPTLDRGAVRAKLPVGQCDFGLIRVLANDDSCAQPDGLPQAEFQHAAALLERRELDKRLVLARHVNHALDLAVAAGNGADVALSTLLGEIAYV